MAELIESASELKTVTPMMQQYLDVKDQYRGYVLMYRLGDFYEMFFEDAILASRELELTLTGRDCGNGYRAAMCGVPFHKADVYVGKLVEKGYKVAICEQTEDPALAEGLVKREVIRVVTPGTVTDGSLLSDGKNNYLCSVYYSVSGLGLGFCDVSTGQISVTCLAGQDILSRLQSECASYQPSEVLLNVDRAVCPEICSYFTETLGAILNDNRETLFRLEEVKPELLRTYGEEECARFDDESEMRAAGALLFYIRETQMCEASFVRELNVYKDGQYLALDPATRRNLELTETMRDKAKKGSLLWVLDHTETAMGARMLRAFLQKPLLSPAAITRRQSAVRDLTADLPAREDLRVLLSHIFDLERLTAKAVYGTANPKDFRAIATSLSYLPELIRLLSKFRSPRLAELCASTDTLEDIYELLDSSITTGDPPYSIRDGGIIRDGYNADVDYLRSIDENGRSWIEKIETEERESTGIKTLRVSYNKVFGYYIEVTKSLIDQVPDRYIRKQTLVNCERYITQELKDMEATILGAKDKLCALEYELFCEIRDKVAAASSRIQATAAAIAEVDVYMSLADVAVKNRYVCPDVDLSSEIVIRDGRHPVVERFVKDSYFVPNDTELDCNANRLMLITGPNMAGKSTYMRQVTLIVIMAQIGSFVPAREARIGIVDKVFTRIGASDDLAAGQSTFMLEMNEVATILKNATKNSLIVYDEVGRGTSTYDGMSIARAVAEYTASKKIGAKTLFATHYHELTVLEDMCPGVVNYHIAAKKRGDGIIFLRKILRGATDDSYGIEVAKLAGVPNDVIKRAREILEAIESDAPKSETKKAVPTDEPEDLFTALRHSENDEVADKLRELDLNTLTPIEAMTLLYEWKKILSSDRSD